MILKQLAHASLFVALMLACGEVCAGTPKPPPVLVIEASYPGASAIVVADTVAAPIEKQVNGVEGLMQMASRSNNDGTYLLALTFKPGTDIKQAKQLVQNRLALAMPMLPQVVNLRGMTMKERYPVRMIVTLTSPDGKYDTLYLSNYATIHVKVELNRIAGVGDTMIFGLRERNLRIWLDPLKLQARNLSALDVVKALESQNVVRGGIGEPPGGKKEPRIIISGLGRLTNPKEIEDIVVKTTKGAVIYLKDVGRVEDAPASTDNHVSLNGKPAVVLAVYPLDEKRAKEFGKSIAAKIAELRARLPKGLRLEVDFDFTDGSQSEYLVLDLDMPESASLERIREALSRCEKLAREIEGVQDTLAMTEGAFDIVRSQPCVLLRLAPANKRKMSRDEIARSLRATFKEIPDGLLRLRELSSAGGISRFSYPINFAISGPDAHEVQELAQKLADRLVKSKKLIDAHASRDSAEQPQLQIQVDRAKAAEFGVKVQEIMSTIQVHVGGMYVNDFNSFGRNWQVIVQSDAKLRKSPQDLANIQIRTEDGKMVPLDRVAKMQTVGVPMAVVRLDMLPMVEITANPAGEVADARKLCETLFIELRKESRTPDTRLTWLMDSK